MTSAQRRLPGWLLPAGIGLVVVTLVAVALLRGPVTLEPDSPEGTVQEYLVAINEERWDDAIEVVHDDWRGACEGTDLRAHTDSDFTAELGNGQNGFGGAGERSMRAPAEPDAEEPTIPEDRSEVEVTINHNPGRGIGGGWNEHVVFELIDDGEFWWLVNDPWPYFTWDCSEG